MDTPFIGEIKLFSGTKVPADWLLCDGAILKPKEHEALHSLIGNKYGGNGVDTFHLPDLRGRIPLGQSKTYPLAQKGGSESVTLTVEQLPPHGHTPSCNTSSTATSPDANGAVWGSVNKVGFGYTNPPGNLTLNNESISIEGDDEAHENRMPFLASSYIICEFGLYPNRD